MCFVPIVATIHVPSFSVYFTWGLPGTSALAAMNKTFVSLLVAFAILGGLLVFQGTRHTASSVFTPEELAQRGAETVRRVRLGGVVAEEGLFYTTDGGFKLSFQIQDRKNPGIRLPVVYNNIKPDMFAPGRDVLLDGDWQDKTFVASQLLTQCPSKYEPPNPGGGASPKRLSSE